MYKKSYKSKYAKVLVMAFNRSIATEIREKIKNITKYIIRCINLSVWIKLNSGIFKFGTGTKDRIIINKV